MKILSPIRVRHELTQELHGSVADVFPLLCPVREAEWIEGWDPEVVFSGSGHGEEDCAFLTRERGEEAVWVITRHEPSAGILELIKTVPGSVLTRISIQLSDAGQGRSRARIAYQHTSLSPKGDRVVATFTRERYEEFMERWEARLSHFLATGRMLRAEVG